MNNPFIAERCAKERQATASQIKSSASVVSGVFSHQLPDLSRHNQSSLSQTADHHLSRFDQHTIDPSLRNAAISGNGGKNNEDIDNESGAEEPSWEEYHSGCGDNSSDRASRESDEEPESRRVVAWRHLNLTLGLAPRYGLSR